MAQPPSSTEDKVANVLLNAERNFPGSRGSISELGQLIQRIDQGAGFKKYVDNLFTIFCPDLAEAEEPPADEPAIAATSPI